MSQNSSFSSLEINILKSKGLDDQNIAAMNTAGISSKADFMVIGDAQTLADVAKMPLETAKKVMEWASGKTTNDSGTDKNPTILVDNSDTIYCSYCKQKQPKDYKSGDLCVSCGKQVEPIATCYWCSTSGPGKFCRSCGAVFVPIGELELALYLKSEGIAKEEIAPKLLKMTAEEKATLWEKVRRPRR